MKRKIVEKENEIVSQKSLVADIDKYVEIDRVIKRFKKEKDEIKKEFKDLQEGRHLGELYDIIISESMLSFEFDIEGLYKKLGKAKFLTVVNISSEKLGKVLGETEIEKFVLSQKPLRKITIKEKKDDKN